MMTTSDFLLRSCMTPVRSARDLSHPDAIIHGSQVSQTGSPNTAVRLPERGVVGMHRQVLDDAGQEHAACHDRTFAVLASSALPAQLVPELSEGPGPDSPVLGSELPTQWVLQCISRLHHALQCGKKVGRIRRDGHQHIPILGSHRWADDGNGQRQPAYVGSIEGLSGRFQGPMQVPLVAHELGSGPE